MLSSQNNYLLNLEKSMPPLRSWSHHASIGFWTWNSFPQQMHQLPLFEKIAETLQCENFLNHCRHAKFVVHHQQNESRPCKYPAVTSGSLLLTPTSNQIIRRLYPGVDTAVKAKPKRFQFIISVRMPHIVWPFATVLCSIETILWAILNANRIKNSYRVASSFYQVDDWASLWCIGNQWCLRCLSFRFP